jgi:hypothetical protein
MQIGDLVREKRTHEIFLVTDVDGSWIEVLGGFLVHEEQLEVLCE